ncbi:Protein of unknown function DUF2254, membrane [Fibrisoma limi BUZ 3]|uniref:DUF2254 domain-containing protein n=1 Tax=Fibrisoma limi BUZ 3 TaxID=1185876 RepID=I2GPW5_9BACT|nr:DUF2254 domain-containing protein [Fibrisoma limi]CCH55943.1 Protein of unknown function DUF2254, membrane [Fibrisoma limi BUZ 3]
MNNRLGQYWQQLRESLWFVPSLMVLGSFGLAYGLIRFDAETSWQGTKRFPLLFGVGADGSRGMLTAIAGSMLTVAALIFSLTLSAISQVSSQYSPRVLRNFMRDRVNQIVMGYFVGVFAYSLVVLGTIRGSDEGKFVPATAVLVSLILALGGVAALIYFIHHIAESLQTGTIVQHIFHETGKAIETLFPDEFGEPVDDPDQAEAALQYSDEQTGWWPILSTQTGYLQRISTDELLHWATHNRVVLRIEKEIGSFVGEGTVLFSVRSGMERPDPDQADWPDDLMQFVSIGRHRNVEQDVAFGIQQLVDIALKALSPGINDTTTAIMAIDYLGAIGGQLARRDFPARLRSDGKHVRVMVRAADFDDYIRLAFDLPRLNADGNHAVFRRLLRALALVAADVNDPDRKAVLQEQANYLLTYAEQTLPTDYEKASIRSLYSTLRPVWM